MGALELAAPQVSETLMNKLLETNVIPSLKEEKRCEPKLRPHGCGSKVCITHLSLSMSISSKCIHFKTLPEISDRRIPGEISRNLSLDQAITVMTRFSYLDDQIQTLWECCSS